MQKPKQKPTSARTVMYSFFRGKKAAAPYVYRLYKMGAAA